MARTRRRRSWALLSVFALALASAALPALSALAGAERCCEEMAGHAGAHCEGLSPARCCDCPHPVYTSSNAPVPPVSAASAALPAPPVRLAGGGALSPACLPDLRARLIRSVVLRL